MLSMLVLHRKYCGPPPPRSSGSTYTAAAHEYDVASYSKPRIPRLCTLYYVSHLKMRTRPPCRRVRRIVCKGEEASSPPGRCPRARCRLVLEGGASYPKPRRNRHLHAATTYEFDDVLYSKASSIGRCGLVDSSEVALEQEINLERVPRASNRWCVHTHIGIQYNKCRPKVRYSKLPRGSI